MAEESQKYRAELMKFIKLIMSSKSKETMQKEAMNYLSSDMEFFQEIIFDRSHQTKIDPDVKDVEQLKDKYESSEKRMTFEDKSVSLGKMNKETGHTTIFPKKRKRPKYENVDFSQIYREPKTSKYNQTSIQQGIKQNQAKYPTISQDEFSYNSSFNEVTEEDNLGYMRNLFNMFPELKPTDGKIECTDGNHETEMCPSSFQMPTCSSNQDCLLSTLPGDNKETDVSSLVNVLVQSKCKAHQEKVLDVLRSNEQVRHSFLKEISGLKGIKIPVFNNSASSRFQNKASDPRRSASSTGSTCKITYKDHLESQNTPPFRVQDENQADQRESVGVNFTSHKESDENNHFPLDAFETNLYPSSFWLQDQEKGTHGPLAGTSKSSTDNAFQMRYLRDLTDGNNSFIFESDLHPAGIEGTSKNDGFSNSGCDEIQDLESQLYLSNNPPILLDNQSVTE